jgi:hypothetical protein
VRNLLVFSLLGCAQISLAFAAELGIAASSQNYTATESLNGQFFNRDSGSLSGAALSVKWGNTEQPFNLTLSDHQGALKYFGLNQIGLPVSSFTKLNVYSAELRLPPVISWTEQSSDQAQISVLPLIYTRTINRDIQSTPLASGLNEKLTQTGLGLTLLYDVLRVEKIQLSLSLTAQYPIQSRLNARFEKRFDPAVTSPSARPEYLVALTSKLLLVKNVSIVAQLKHHEYRPGQSKGVPLLVDGMNAGSLIYPGSKQRTTGLSVGLNFGF